MWHKLADFILRFRIALLAVVALLTVGMGYFGQFAQVQQEFVKVVPEDDPEYKAYVAFKKVFGEDGNAVVVGLGADNFFKPEILNALQAASDSVAALPGVTRVLNMTRVFDLKRDDQKQTFVLAPVMNGPVRTQEDADSLKRTLQRLPFYNGILFNDSLTATMFLVTLDQKILATKDRHKLVNDIQANIDNAMKPLGVRTYYSGVPYLRSYIAQKLPKELQLFMILAIVFTAITLYVLFRSRYAVIIPLVLILVITVWTFGWIGILGYKITLITALIPPMIIIISVAPFVYMISDYHQEYAATKNNKEALGRMLRRLGLVTLMINANTAFGFLTLYFTNVIPLREFGMLAFLSSITAFIITILAVPAAYSLLPDPSGRRLKHLSSKPIQWLLEKIILLVARRRGMIFLIAAGICTAGVIGLTRLKPVSYMVDDLPKSDAIFTDQAFLERNFDGVMPFEIEVNTQRKGGVRKLSTLKQIAEVQDVLQKYPEISRTISFADAIKFSRQAFYDGYASQYSLPINEEFPLIASYAQGSVSPDDKKAQAPILSNLVDSTYTRARITGFVKDIGSQEMPALLKRIEADLTQIFDTTGVAPDRQIKFAVTGTTKIFLKSNDYLINNLVWSLAATFALVALQMLFLFRSWRIMTLALLPNLIPLIATAGIMGFFNIPLKPSTALIYGIAFTIAVDDSIHYLAAYRMKRKHGKSIPSAVTGTLRGTGQSMIYTGIVLFSGFVIFAPSAFSSTQALGILTSSTLFIAIFSNLLLLPALLVQFDQEKAKIVDAPIDEAEDDEEDDDEPAGPTDPAAVTTSGKAE